jgi:hypothetical protein
VLVGMRHAPEQVCKGRQIARTGRLEMIQRLERLAQRRKLLLLGAVDAKPGANRFQRHVKIMPLDFT